MLRTKDHQHIEIFILKTVYDNRPISLFKVRYEVNFHLGISKIQHALLTRSDIRGQSV